MRKPCRFAGWIAVVRSPSDAELPAVLRLVVEVAIQTYGGECPALAASLQQDPSAEFGTPEAWRGSLVAAAGNAIAGVAQVEGNQVSDLWVAVASRGLGLGSALLAACEERIRSAGHGEARLNVVSTNERALAFYLARGWVEVGRRPSPRWPLPPYVDLVKVLR